MAIWDPADELNHPLDFLLIQNGFVTLVFEPRILEKSTSFLRHRGYRVISLDAASWKTPVEMHTDLASALQFPAHYGANLDALNDCLSDVATRTYGWSESDTGLVCVLNGYDEFLVQNRATAQSILDIYSRQAAYAALFGHRMMCLVKSSDRQIHIAPVGGTPVSWNHLELHNSLRRSV